MQGDGLGGLVVAIIFAGIGMLVLPALGLGLLLRQIPTVKTSKYRDLVGVAGGVLGAALGLVWVTATFFESTWSPPPNVVLTLPTNFKYRSVIFLEKSTAPTVLQWSGYKLPFMSKQTAVDIPASGVVAVRSLEGLAGESFEVKTQNGLRVTGWGSGPGPSELGAVRYVHMHLENETVQTTQIEATETLFVDSKAFAAYIQKRQATAKVAP